jgi:hypothetical protein
MKPDLIRGGGTIRGWLKSATGTRRPRALSVAAIALIALGASCGGTTTISNPFKGVLPDSSSASTTPTSTTSSIVSAGPLLNTWTQPVSKANGYSGTVKLSAGNPQHFVPNLINNGFIAGSLCTINPKSDAVIPFEVEATNTTQGFSFTITATLMKGYVLMDSITNAEWQGSGTCQPEAGTLYSATASQLAPGAETATYGFFVLGNYYSPANPTGTPLEFQEAVVQMLIGPATGPGCPCDGGEVDLAGTAIPPSDIP